METTRQNKISRLLQKELSEIFLLQTKAMPGVLVSVSAVRISPDMSIARVYLSIFPSEKSEEMVKNINNNMKWLSSRQSQLLQRVSMLRALPLQQQWDHLSELTQLNISDLTLDNGLKLCYNN